MSAKTETLEQRIHVVAEVRKNMGFVFILFAIEDHDRVGLPTQTHWHLYKDVSYDPNNLNAKGALVCRTIRGQICVESLKQFRGGVLALMQ